VHLVAGKGQHSTGCRRLSGLLWATLRETGLSRDISAAIS
jgi:hypothetical protein